MSWMCDVHAEAVIQYWARCGSCGWSQQFAREDVARLRADGHRQLHEDLWESSGNTDTGDWLKDEYS